MATAFSKEYQLNSIQFDKNNKSGKKKQSSCNISVYNYFNKYIIFH